MSIFRRKQTVAERKVVHEVRHGFLGKLAEAVKGLVKTSYDSTKPDRLPHPNYMDSYVELCSDPTVAVSLDIKKNAIVPDFYFEMPDAPEGEPDKKQRVEAVVMEDPKQVLPETSKDIQKPLEKPKPKKKHPNQVKLEAWKKDTKAVKKLKQIVGTMLAKGFCPVMVEDDFNLKILPPESFYIYRDKYGKVLKYTQEQNVGNTVSAWAGSELDKVILFLNDEDTDHPYGEADVESLVTLLDTRHQLNADMGKIIHRFSSPFGILRTSGSAADIQTSITDKDVDEILYLGNTNKDEVELLFVEPDPQCKFLPYIDSVDFQIGQRLNAPTMLLLKNATEASATKMLDAFNVWVQSFQNELAETLEERIFKKICPSGPIPVMRFGAPREVLDEITLPDINNCTDKTISKRQAQDLLKKKGIELIEDEEFLNKEPEPPISPFGKPAPFGTKPKTEIPVEAVEKLNDLQMALDLIAENYKMRKLTVADTCRSAENAIRVYMQRCFPDDWQERYEAAFKLFIKERLGGSAKHSHQETYTVKVE